MKLRGKEIIVHRGETFSLDMVIRNRDGTPFIISSDVSNPYVLLSVSSANYMYNSDDRYLCNWWISLEKLPKFYSTKPVEIDEFTSENVAIDGENYLYTAVENGVRKYKYWDKGTKTFVDYEFRIVKQFNNSETQEWIENAYVYSISFVAGQDSYTYLESIWDVSWGEMPKDLSTAWSIATSKDSSILNVLEYDAPICNYSDVLVFIEPSKLTVLSNIKGSL